MKVIIVKFQKDGKTVEGKFNYKYYNGTFHEESITDIVDIAYPDDFICDIKVEENEDDTAGIC